MLGSRRHHDWDCPYPRRGYLTVFPPRPAARSLSRHPGWMPKDTCPFKLAIDWLSLSHTHAHFVFTYCTRHP